ncbi:thiamine-phosphate kinase [Heliorestis convoluta]|uniref:Thiamine-monophosphate kinase n=1 Tax=Heliorestis convoluta TaxID=356322 RepID=A0A5Q2N0M7_9FIRM|nr:thiamine-phosphate kinase [Heliorestis convoluta]QGG48427.1 thiamine-monophosphate kinase [Heliorestis convoluta]
MVTPINRIGEFGLIDKLAKAWSEGASETAPSYKQMLQQIGGINSDKAGPFLPRLAVGDDGAILDVPSHRPLLTTTDMLVEKVHFLWSPERIASLGHKAMAVNISDIAAMGGLPTWAFLSIAIPPVATVEEVVALYRAMGETAGRYGISLAGGDTVRSDQWVINVTLMGLAIKEPVRRSGGKPGDLLVATGWLGDAAAGLHLLLSGKPFQEMTMQEQLLLHRHLEPTPRVKEAVMLVQQKAVKAMLDISDGLSSEIHHLCKQSDCGALLDLSRLPIRDETTEIATSTGQSALSWALSGGEDFELLFAIDKEKVSLLSTIEQKTGTKCTIIGELTPPNEGINAFHGPEHKSQAFPLRAKGYNHF